MTELAEPALSICIPTYNRATLLAELLERIAIELSEPARDDLGQVEVVVSDNASPDDTMAIVARYRSRIQRLIYVRQPANVGPDRNFLSAVATANGRHCWLMGDDDMPEPGAIARILQVLGEHNDIAGMSIDRFARSFDLQTRRSEDVFPTFEESTVLVGAETVFTRLTEYIAFLSAQVVDRALWNDVVRDSPVEDFLNSYVHMYVIAEMVKRNPRWLVLKERLVTWRADNDSFMAGGRFRRMKIDVVGYDQIARACFGEGSPTHRAIRDTIASRNFRMHITAARMEGVWSRDMRGRTWRLAMRYYARSPRFWIMAAPFLLLPNSLLPVLKYAQRRVHHRRARRIGMNKA